MNNKKDELNGLIEYASKTDADEQDFWTEFYERGFVPEDFGDNKEKREWAKTQLEHYGLI